MNNTNSEHNSRPMNGYLPQQNKIMFSPPPTLSSISKATTPNVIPTSNYFGSSSHNPISNKKKTKKRSFCYINSQEYTFFSSQSN